LIEGKYVFIQCMSKKNLVQTTNEVNKCFGLAKTEAKSSRVAQTAFY